MGEEAPIVIVPAASFGFGKINENKKTVQTVVSGRKPGSQMDQRFRIPSAMRQ